MHVVSEVVSAGYGYCPSRFSALLFAQGVEVSATFFKQDSRFLSGLGRLTGSVSRAAAETHFVRRFKLADALSISHGRSFMCRATDASNVSLAASFVSSGR